MVDAERIFPNVYAYTSPGDKQVNLKIRVYENGQLQFEENIRETIHDLLRQSGFEAIKCADRLLDTNNPGTTWFVIAQKKEEHNGTNY